ncbi:hypothetical protein BHE74_00025693 [Ensete ventricosum]|nr:hypothetical protein BHE74_00025693 [Ensete ventricosum]RZS03051.1 hypothetical protein BHM03_00033173 [Ensete ventricosum]
MSSIVLRAMQSPLSPVSDWRCYFHGGFDFTVVEQPGVVSAELRPEEARRLIMHSAKDERSFEALTPYLIEAFDRGTNVTQLAEVKLGSEGLSTGYENTETGTLEEYAIVLSFKLS